MSTANGIGQFDERSLKLLLRGVVHELFEALDVLFASQKRDGGNFRDKEWFRRRITPIGHGLERLPSPPLRMQSGLV